jgi:hypothetical protein
MKSNARAMFGEWNQTRKYIDLDESLAWIIIFGQKQSNAFLQTPMFRFSGRLPTALHSLFLSAGFRQTTRPANSVHFFGSNTGLASVKFAETPSHFPSGLFHVPDADASSIILQTIASPSRNLTHMLERVLIGQTSGEAFSAKYGPSSH